MNTVPNATEPPEVFAQLDDWLRSCIHCGLCLDSCPTYRVTGDEAESPRGRLMIMGELFKVGAAAPSAQLGSALGATLPQRTHVDHCLGCRGCESVCPSGVAYGRALEDSRALLGPASTSRLRVWMIDRLLSSPRWLWPLSQVGQRLRGAGVARWLPGFLREPLEALPSRPAVRPRPPKLAAHGDVALLAGCAQQVFSPDVLRAAATLVSAATGQTPTLPPQGCCGALSHHAGSVAHAKGLGRRLIRALDGYSTIVVPSAGCSAHMRDFGHLFSDEPSVAPAASRVAAAAVDLVPWLAEHGTTLRFRDDPRRIAYHPPCHHRHAQGIVDEPFELLARVPGLSVTHVDDGDRCCGSAGSYNLLQPRLAVEVRSDKLDSLQALRPELLLTANPGCELFLDQGLRARGDATPVRHLASYLAERLVE